MKLIRTFVLALLLLALSVPALAIPPVYHNGFVNEIYNNMRNDVPWNTELQISMEIRGFAARDICIVISDAFDRLKADPDFESIITRNYTSIGTYVDYCTANGWTIHVLPKTGDGANLMLWSSLLLVSAIGTTAMARRKHSRI